MKYYLMMAVAAFSSVIMVSCDQFDRDMEVSLEGSVMRHVDEYGNIDSEPYKSTDMFSSYQKCTIFGSWLWNTDCTASYTTSFGDEDVTFHADKTYMVFYRLAQYSRSGYGKQIDRYTYGPYVEVFRTFRWALSRKGYNVTIKYNDDDSVLELQNVGINAEYFSGTVDSTDVCFSADNSIDWDFYSSNINISMRERENWESHIIQTLGEW